MSDDKLRNLERDAAGGDPEADGQLRRERCRVGQCCACDERAPSIPGPPKEAYGSVILIEATHYQEPYQEIVGPSGERELLQGYGAEANLQLRIIGPGAMPALEWLRSVFEVQDGETGIMDMRVLGGRLVPAQKSVPVVVNIVHDSIVIDVDDNKPVVQDEQYDEHDHEYREYEE